MLVINFSLILFSNVLCLLIFELVLVMVFRMFIFTFIFLILSMVLIRSGLSGFIATWFNAFHGLNCH